MSTAFGQHLRRLRDEAGLSQEALAERAGLSINTISMYERGSSGAPRHETIALLAGALNLQSDALEQFKDSARPCTPHNLPWHPTSFVGRRREVEEISRLLTQRHTVTVTGTGGIGKTRIALEVASRISKPPADGTWFVDLASANDWPSLLRKIASVLELRIPERGDPLEALLTKMRTRHLLLILDNCEHLIEDTRSIVTAITNACPSIALLATSRERFGIASETVYKLDALPLPTQPVTTVAEGRSYDALELFAERAESAVATFVISDDHIEAVADICRRLDGIALAIELAASRVPVMGLTELRNQLTKHFHVVAGSRRDLPPRHQTLNATISWSHNLLCESERIVFRRLAIFVNGWSLDAAESVCSDDPLPRASVAEALFSLIDKSLVVTDFEATAPRYAFYDSTHAFANERLDDAGERPHLARRHAEWMAHFADSAYDLLTPSQQRMLTTEVELENAISALEWALSSAGDGLLAGRIASGLRGFWLTTGLAGFGRQCIGAALERIDPQQHPELVARLLVAQFKFIQGTPSLAADSMRRAIALLDGTDDVPTLARCYAFLAHALGQLREHAAAEEAIDISLAILQKEGLLQSTLHTGLLLNRGTLFRVQGRLDEAQADLSEALSFALAMNDDWCVSLCETTLANIEFSSGNIQRAAAIGEQAVVSARRVRGVNQEIQALLNLAGCRLILGEIDAAEASAQDAFKLAHSAGPEEFAMHVALQHLFAVAALRGFGARAARGLGYVNAWFERTGATRDPIDQQCCDILVTALREQLSEQEINDALSRGAQLTERAAIQEAVPSH